MSRPFCTSLLLLMLVWPASLPAEGAAAGPTDLIEPRGEPGLVQRLELITVATLSLAETERFYRQGYGLEFEGPIELAPQAMLDQRQLWGVGVDFGWVEYRLSRPATWGMPRIRLLALTAPAEPARTDWNATAPGAQGIGFATRDAAALADRLQTLGFGGTPLRDADSRRSDESAVAERIADHHGPDFVRASARERIAAEPYAPLDDSTGVGGPAWLSISTADVAASLDFWSKALDLEVRSDRTVPDGDGEQRQLWLYARGARTGAVELRVVPAPAESSTAEGLRRGIVGAGFVIHDLPTVQKRLRRAGVEPAADAVVPLPMLGTRRVLSLRSPEGLIVELIEGG